ncbi:right-handed parallel beta-helix repeat-containing protein [Georgenia daeguensis]|uniref:Right handed beta helix domain-containing protein n=1 Tax=Georgenia daeguensis TaxID=908355 RepID=A0ABP8EVX1_9MICO
MRISRLLAAGAVALAATTGTPAAALTGPADTLAEPGPVVHVSPTGTSTGTGTADDPAGSLARAVELLTAAGGTTATIVVGEGTYHEARSVSFRSVPQDVVTLRPAEAGTRPIFDGSLATGASHYWLNTAGGPSLDVAGLEVRDYRTGGIRMDTDDNIVDDVVFTHLGNRHVPDGPGYAALHLLGSSGNVISGNVFENLENDSCPGCIHGVYAANGSSDNLVAGNVFDRIMGDPVRLRHDTHDNVFTHNVFTRSGDYLDADGRWAHRAMASFWRFRADEICGTGNRVDHNTTDGRTYSGEVGQRMFGSGAEEGLERCALAVLGSDNVVDTSLAR